MPKSYDQCSKSAPNSMEKLSWMEVVTSRGWMPSGMANLAPAPIPPQGKIPQTLAPLRPGPDPGVTGDGAGVWGGGALLTAGGGAPSAGGTSARARVAKTVVNAATKPAAKKDPEMNVRMADPPRCESVLGRSRSPCGGDPTTARLGVCWALAGRLRRPRRRSGV